MYTSGAGPANTFNLSSRRSRNVFFGNMPDTARVMICPEGQYASVTKTQGVTDSLWTTFSHAADRHLLQTADEPRVMPVQLLRCLVSRQAHTKCVRYHDIVSGVDLKKSATPLGIVPCQ